jgi:hypothetical protein
MTDCKRNGKRWTTSEVLKLQREYELLNLSVQEIAQKHKRSEQSILFKLYLEELTPSLYEAKGYTSLKKTKPIVQEKEEDTDSSSDYQGEADISEYSEIDDNFSEKDDSVCVECNLDKLSERVWSLETSVGEINTIVNNTNKRKILLEQQINLL